MKRRHQPPISNINVVPYLDVMLVLLVIFMITAPLFNQGVVELPPTGDIAAAPGSPVALEIIYEVNDLELFSWYDYETQAESDGKITEEELLEKLGGIRILSPDKPIIISADGEKRHRQTIKLLGQLHDLGFTKVSFSVKNE